LTATKRKVAVVRTSTVSWPQFLTPFVYSIVDNLSKLVNSPITLRPFLPKLLPGLIKVETTIGGPETCSIVGRAIFTLRQVGEVPTGDALDLPPPKLAKASQLVQSLAPKSRCQPSPVC
jgi:hypothetical protein